MNYLKIGNQLKLVRERKGLSYHQVFEITRIQPSILRDIEEGTADMAPVLLKSFIKMYCRFLGLNFEKLTQQAISDEPLREQKKAIDKAKNNQHVREILGEKKKFLKYFMPILAFVLVFQLLIFLGLPKKNFTKLFTENDIGESQVEFTEVKKPQKPLNSDLKSEPYSQSFFKKIQQSVFKHEILIQSSNPLNIYFKPDNYSTINKTLSPFIWFYIKARKSLYLRFDDKQGEVQVFYNGEQVDLGNNRFFERKFE